MDTLSRLNLIGTLTEREAFIGMREVAVFPYGVPESDDAEKIVKALSYPTEGYIIWPGHASKLGPANWHHLLTHFEIEAHPLLRNVQRLLPAYQRLWVVVWPDGTVIMAAFSRTAVTELPVWWYCMLHDEAWLAPRLAKATQKRESSGARYYAEQQTQKRGGGHGRPRTVN